MLRYGRLGFCVGALFCCAAANADIETRVIFGWVEKIRLEADGIELKAKLDTGANTSSINAEDIEVFRRDGERWVAFSIIDPESGKAIRYERPRTRAVRIRRGDGTFDRRQVVEMRVCFGTYLRTFEITLADRSELTYPMLIGRNALEGLALVDPAETFLQDYDCASATSADVDAE